MAWTAPRTWVLGENVSAATMNLHVRDNPLFLYEKIQIGTLEVIPVASTVTTVVVTFPFAFASTPYVVATGATSCPGTVLLGVALTASRPPSSR